MLKIRKERVDFARGYAMEDRKDEMLANAEEEVKDVAFEVEGVEAAEEAVAEGEEAAVDGAEAVAENAECECGEEANDAAAESAEADEAAGGADAESEDADEEDAGEDAAEDSAEELEEPSEPGAGSRFMGAAMKAMGSGARSLKRAASEVSKEQNFKASELAFIKDTVLTLSPGNFEKLRDTLFEDCLRFWFIPKDDITPEVLAEKLYDYFYNTLAVTGAPFDKQVFQYIKSVSDLVDMHIEQAKELEDGTQEEAPRARRFYEKAQEIKESRSASTNDILEFSRLMFCLYEATLRDRLNKIQDFDYSVDVIDPAKILDAMKKETVEGMLGMKRKVFNLEGTCTQDISTMIIAAISLYKIAEDRA